MRELQENFNKIEKSWEIKMIRLKIISLLANDSDMSNKDFELLSMYIDSLKTCYKTD